MNNIIIRFQEIELINFKNVSKGVITFPEFSNNNHFSNKAEIVGVYGQNGSGKTALIEALWIIKHAISGMELPPSTHNLININSETANIKLTFTVDFVNESQHQVFYDIELRKNAESNFVIAKEKIETRKNIDGKYTSKSMIFSFDIDQVDYLFSPIKHHKLLAPKSKPVYIEYAMSKSFALTKNVSYIFNSQIMSLNSKNDSFYENTRLLQAIQDYISTDMFVISNESSGLINANTVLPFRLSVMNSNRLEQIDIGFSLSGTTLVPEKYINDIRTMFQTMNMVLKTIIPGLEVKLNELNIETLADGKTGIRTELLALKGTTTIPIQYESDGIKKIISILSNLISTYNNPSTFLAVDELDAGIYEYLLGELLEIFSESGKGQLLFTSHNLRPLEKINADSLYFTTTNPENRFTRLKYVKTNNNIRSLYYRSINLGGQQENLYEETDGYEIRRAFRKAGRMNHAD